MPTILLAPEYNLIFLISIGLLGLLVGSFLNVVIARLPYMDTDAVSESPEKPKKTFNLAIPSSHCPHCQHPIAWFDNIPLLSFLWLKGRCRACQKSISWQYPLVELLTLAASILVAIHFGFTVKTLAGLLLTWALIVLAFIDYNHTILPDDITLPFLWLGLLLSVFNIFTTPEIAILGAASGYLVLWCVYLLFKWCTAQDGMGHGDFKLLAMLGAWLGWQSLPIIILISSFLGSLIGISLILIQKRNKNIPIPFGPFLAIGGFSALLWGPNLQLWYFRLLL